MNPGIQVAESAKPRKREKVLDHLEIHPQLGGGHIVKHVYTNYDHESKEYKFNEGGVAKGGEHIQAHLDKHAGLPAHEKSDKGSETEEEVDA